MIISICSSQFTKLLNHVRLNKSIEVVGIGVGVINGDYVRVRYIELCKNIAENPEFEFLIDPSCFYRVYRIIAETGEDVVAIIHSHVVGDVKPSIRDLSNMRLWGIPWIIINSEGVYRAWILSLDGEPVAIESLAEESC